jgi:cell division protein FtsB
MSMTEDSGIVKMFLTTCIAAISTLAGVLGWIGRYLMARNEQQEIENNELIKENATYRERIAKLESQQNRKDESDAE